MTKQYNVRVHNNNNPCNLTRTGICSVFCHANIALFEEPTTLLLCMAMFVSHGLTAALGYRPSLPLTYVDHWMINEDK